MTIEIKDGVLYIRGREVFLFGGEVQYFRLRDKNFNEARTYDIWAQTLDQIRKAGMNLVTTYVPWDYHESKRDIYNFIGARNLDHFLSMCYERSLYVQVKPGPYITAEWPHGPRTFGAVPLWLKKEYPETLVRTASGGILSFDPLKSKWGRQCTYMHPIYLERVRLWYNAVASIIIKYIRKKPCVWSLQIDNETNLFWNDHYVVDYSPVAISHYRSFLQKRYGEISNLNKLYRSRYRTFEEVEPPRKPLRCGWRSCADLNQVHIDWYDAGWAYVEEYLLILRGMLEKAGIREPEVLFTTNDTPALTPRLGRKILFWRGSMKNKVGLGTLDSYPRCDPLSRQLDNIPYQTDYAATLTDFYGNRYPMKRGSWVMGAEMQGGIFELPILDVEVKPEASARQVTRAVGSGVKAYAMFVIRQGFNLNNTVYRCQAPIDEHGRASERFNVLARAATGLAVKYGKALNRAEPVDAPVAVLTNRDYQVPLAGARFSTLDFWHTSYGGAYGWLKRSGYLPQMADIKDITLDDMKRWKAVVYLDPGLIGAREAELLLRYVQEGGAIIYMGWPSECDLSGRSSPAHRRWSDILPRRFVLSYRRGTRLTFFIEKQRYNLKTTSIVPVWESPSADSEMFLRLPAGGWAGSFRPIGQGTLIFLCYDFSGVFNTSGLYKLKEEDIAIRRLLAWKIMSRIGIERPMDWSPAKAEVWARRAPDGKLFLFCVNDGDASDVSIRPALPQALGIDANRDYRLHCIYEDKEMPAMTGKQIVEHGIKLQMKKWGSEVVCVEPVER